MNDYRLAIYDEEEGYAYHLMEYLGGKKEIPFRIQVFTGKEALITYGKKHSLALLLVGESVFVSEIMQPLADNVLVLREQGDLPEDVDMIEKYQSCENIYKEIMCYLAARKSSPNPRIALGVRQKVIGLFGPLHGAGQTPFGIVLGQVLAKEHKVLYLNFGTFSGLGNQVDVSRGDLMDLMYLMGGMKDKLGYKVSGMVTKMGGLHMIPPAFSFLDLASVQGKDWAKLVMEMKKGLDYEYIIMDYSEILQGIMELLEASERIYTIVRQDAVSMEKQAQYEKVLMATEYEEILEKTVKCTLPAGEIEGYVRTLLTADGGL